MKTQAKRIRLIIGLSTLAAPAAVLALMGGCASAPEKPVAELAQAKALVEQAEQAGAQQFAAADLQRAREQLIEAQQKSKDEKTVEARRLAEAAAVDAELAAAKARQGKAEEAAKELAASVETLRQESGRAADKAERTLQPPQQ